MREEKGNLKTEHGIEDQHPMNKQREQKRFSSFNHALKDKYPYILTP